MSYILDALQKSERERQHALLSESASISSGGVEGGVGAGVDASGHVYASENGGVRTSRVTKPYLRWLMLALMVLVPVAVGLVWLVGLGATEASRPVVERPAAPRLAAPLVRREDEAARRQEGVVNARLDVVEDKSLLSRSQDARPEVALPSSEVSVQPIEQAPAAALSQIPSLTISSHIYSTDAKRRSIVVNDQRYKEGASLAPGVVVYRITRQGMSLSVDDLLLSVGRSRGWAP